MFKLVLLLILLSSGNDTSLSTTSTSSTSSTSTSKKLASHTLEITDIMLAYYITSCGFVKKEAGGNYTITIICIKV